MKTAARPLGLRLLLPVLLAAGPALAQYVAEVPYFHQYSNRLNPSGSCQNTCVAMVLKYYGAEDITPDQLSATWGTSVAQTTEGLARVFNTEAAARGLRVRDQAVESGTLRRLHALLDEGKPVIVHGGFSSVGHLLVLVGYDANHYYANDPASRWTERLNGGFTQTSDPHIGRYTRYQRAAVEQAILSGDHRRRIRMHALYLAPGPLAATLTLAGGDSLAADLPFTLRATVRLDTLPGAEVTASADLSELGGAAAHPLFRLDERTFQLEAELPGPTPGRRRLRVYLRQGGATEVLRRILVVLPAANLLLYGDDYGGGWRRGLTLNTRVDSAATVQVQQGVRALALEAQGFTLELLPPAPLELAGYRALRLAFHPGTSTPGARPALAVQLNGDVRKLVSLLGPSSFALDPQRREWQEIEIPLAAFYPLEDSLSSLRLFGTLQGTFFLDELSLVSARFPAPALTGAWLRPGPDSLLAGSHFSLRQLIAVQRGVAEGPPAELSADLSELGGPAALPLRSDDGQTYTLEAELDLPATNGVRQLRVRLRQGTLESELHRPVLLLPAEDQLIFGDEYGENWRQGFTDAVGAGPRAGEEVFAGQRALAIEARAYTIEQLARRPVDLAGYQALRFAFHPGQAVAGNGGAMAVMLDEDPNTLVTLGPDAPAGARLETNRRQWQQIEIPLAAFGDLEEPLGSIRFFGSLQGLFYLDEVRLVAARPPAATAVAAEPSPSLPRATALGPNFPNPFNSRTTIPFALAEPGWARLELFDLQGQRVARLASGWYAAGPHRVGWDAADDQGRALASGVYCCRLETGGRVWLRKLLLLR